MERFSKIKESLLNMIEEEGFIFSVVKSNANWIGVKQNKEVSINETIVLPNETDYLYIIASLLAMIMDKNIESDWYFQGFQNAIIDPSGVDELAITILNEYDWKTIKKLPGYQTSFTKKIYKVISKQEKNKFN